jgi:hypothetical protein
MIKESTDGLGSKISEFYSRQWLPSVISDEKQKQSQCVPIAAYRIHSKTLLALYIVIKKSTDSAAKREVAHSFASSSTGATKRS